MDIEIMVRLHIETMETDDDLKVFVDKIKKDGYVDTRFGRVDIHRIDDLSIRLYDNWVGFPENNNNNNNSGYPIYIFNHVKERCYGGWKWSHTRNHGPDWVEVFTINDKVQGEQFRLLDDIPKYCQKHMAEKVHYPPLPTIDNSIGLKIMKDTGDFIIHGEIIKENDNGMVIKPLVGNMTGGELTIYRMSELWWWIKRTPPSSGYIVDPSNDESFLGE